jgi:hypothetical protein
MFALVHVVWRVLCVNECQSLGFYEFVTQDPVVGRSDDLEGIRLACTNG